MVWEGNVSENMKELVKFTKTKLIAVIVMALSVVGIRLYVTNVELHLFSEMTLAGTFVLMTSIIGTIVVSLLLYSTYLENDL